MIMAPVLHTFSYIMQEVLLSGKRNVTPRRKNGMRGAVDPRAQYGPMVKPQNERTPPQAAGY